MSETQANLERPPGAAGAGQGSPHPGAFYLLTGLSGAGKSLVSQFLEDQGFYCVDNLPPELIEKFIELSLDSRRQHRQVLLVCDIRSGTQFKELLESLNRLSEKGIRLITLYLEANNEVLVRRFSETRRRHPLNSGSLMEDIQTERNLLSDVRSRADLIIDTSNLTGGELKKKLLKLLNETVATRKLNVVLTSFGYKYGIPMDSDLVVDVRFLPNPHYEPDLAHLTGREEVVRNYIFTSEVAREFYQRLLDFLQFLLPQYVAEGKSHLTVAVGCTGGQHRSVAIVELLAQELGPKNIHLVTSHRDVERRLAVSSL